MKTIKLSFLGLIFVFSVFSCKNKNKESNLNDFVVEWNNAISSQNIEKLSSMYDNTVLYYNINKTKNDCLSDKLDFFKKNQNFSQEILGEIIINKINESKQKCKFTKRVNINGNVREYSSYLILRKINNKWKIINESDVVSDRIVKDDNAVVDNNREKVEKPNIIKKIKNTKTNNGNIFIIYSNGEQKQLTFNESDENPILVNKNILFIRNIKENGVNRTYTRKKIMLVSTENFMEKLVTDKKPFKDGNNGSNEIFTISNPTLSLDRKHIYFSVEKWVTANEIVKVNIENGEWTELFSGGYFEYIRKGEYKGYFLISRSEIRDQGRASYYMIVDEKGNVKKDFKDKDSADQFINMIK